MVYSKQKFHPGSLDLRRVAWWKLSLQKYTFFNIQTFFDNYFSIANDYPADQQMHHSVWPPSSNGNNTHCRYQPP